MTTAARIWNQHALDRLRRGARHLLAAVGLVSVFGCSRLTKVAAPDLTQPSALDNPAGAVTRRAGALGQFYVDMSTWALNGGQLTDELVAVYGTSSIDQRILPDNGPGAREAGPYPGPATRTNALVAIALLEQYAPTPASRIGELFAALGTIETQMAEDLCSGVRLAGVSNGLPTPGPALTTTQLYQHALAQFDSAARYAADSARILNWVSIGRARALLDLDSTQAAAAAVATVPTGYSYVAQFSATTTQQNAMAVQLLLGNFAVSDHEGGNGLDFVSGTDPRVPIVDSGLALDQIDQRYILARFSSFGSPITIASGIEARLIEAEAALRAMQVNTWTTTLNNLRGDSLETGVAGLPPLTADSTTTASAVEQLAVMFRERAFWLFATGHRQGDLRRLIRQYGQMQAQVFPTGLYQHTGKPYGSDVTFPVFHDESNTLIAECIDRNA